MRLRLHNTLGRAEQEFVPIDPTHVRVYVCGPTVYDLAHLGNARSAVVFDQLRRVLDLLFPRVTFVRNVTDVDDKIIARARETGEPIRAVTERTHRAYLEDTGALGVLPPDVEPRATDHIRQMQAMIARLVDRGHAYEAEGHVLFEVATNARPGALSGHDMAALRAGARVEVAPWKRDPADFVLWKPSAGDQPGWDSPWGFGRPGWHIECSAMAAEYLGPVFDIHGGGHDLVFPHHENEIAQSTAAHGTERMANYWLHNGMLTVDGRKMSKSAGNFLTVRGLLEGAPGRGEALRLVLLSAHYRHALDFTLERVREAGRTLDRFYGALRSAGTWDRADGETARVMVPLLDDLNTPGALAVLHVIAGELNGAADPADRVRLASELHASGRLIGLLGADPDDWFRSVCVGGAPEAEVEALLLERASARRNRDFARADIIRSDLAAMGVTLEDGASGTSWRRA